MKKIMNKFGIIYLIAIITVCSILLSGCGESDGEEATEGEEVVQEETENVISSSTKNVFLYATENMDDYFKHLNSLDKSVYEILNIDSSEYRSNSTQEYYLITYRKVNAPRAEPKGNMYKIYTSNEDYIFITQDTLLYLDFIDEMDFEKYKILGFSKSGSSLSKGSYIITYTEI